MSAYSNNCIIGHSYNMINTERGVDIISTQENKYCIFLIKINNVLGELEQCLLSGFPHIIRRLLF